MENAVYFEFKNKLAKAANEAVYLKDVINYTTSDDNKAKLGTVVLFPGGINQPVKITSLQIIDLIRETIGEVTIYPLGPYQAIFTPKQTSPGNPVINFIKILGVSVLLFFGSALAIMYFHSDVGMNEAHKSIYYFITGNKEDKPLLISMSYSIGLGIGIALFFDVFSIGKKKLKKKPGPLELELFQNEKELDDYLMSNEEDQGS